MFESTQEKPFKRNNKENKRVLQNNRELTAVEDTDGDGLFGEDGELSATTTFTDAAGSTNKVYQHWADGDAAGRGGGMEQQYSR
jgi:hypothetical protein